MNYNHKAFFFLIKRKLDEKKIPTVTLTVVSDSMYPYICKGDKIVLESCKNKNILRGDIIVFYHMKWATVHRVVEVIVENDQVKYKTKGDNNLIDDCYYVKEKEIIGLVIKVNKGEIDNDNKRL